VKISIRLAALTLAAVALASASDLTGNWLGTYVVFPSRVRLVFHISKSGEKLTALVDNLDEEKYGIAADSIILDGAVIRMQVKALDGVFEGQADEGFERITGKWNSRGKQYSINVVRLRRPQEPVKPLPYREEEVSYENQGVRLAGTLTVPAGKGRWPAVVLVAGAGALDRDAPIMAHRPFLVLADYLTRRGIATLRSDPRGAGKSGGSGNTAGLSDFAGDAEAALAHLRARPEIDAARVGLLGGREGALVATMAAARSSTAAFLVLMPGAGLAGEENLVRQVRFLSRLNGNPPMIANDSANIERQILEIVRGETDRTSAARKLKTVLPSAQFQPEQIEKLMLPWYRDFLEFEPAAALRKIRCPVLSLAGAKDREILGPDNLPVIRQALEDGGNKHFEVAELPGLNHLFQTANTGLSPEYPDVEETIAPLALEKISAWLAQQTR
jgi:uncharacterized protein